ncbi:MAG: amino acid ABC transporter permease [Candidatus Eremiobacteraeota bacterium]|nr:amino acid ABC transporter permease [Candidatus Eremiobacteraeota bacterium]MBV8355905.1 amino acid ABC transporter permease [Candidatus Eremiobacteraeota bacterium]
MRFDFGVFWHLLVSGTFLFPAWTTLWITCAAMTIGITLGLFGALALLSRLAVVRWLAGAYLWIFRGTPVLVQIIFWYDATAELTNNAVNLPALLAGVIALGVNEGAYMSEIVRAGLISVDRGQLEAARSLGMTYGLAMRRIVIPQAIRIILPPTGNQVIGMLKTTSLLFTIAVPEIFATGTNLYSTNFRYFEVLAVVSLWYLFLTSVLTAVERSLERRFGYDRMNAGRSGEGVFARVFRFGGRGAR